MAEARAQHDGRGVRVALWPPILGTRHLLGQMAAHLLGDDDLLHLLEQVFRFGQVQSQRVNVQLAAFHLSHLVHGWRTVVVGLDDELHTHPHATLRSARRRLTARRSKRSISSQRSRCRTSSSWS